MLYFLIFTLVVIVLASYYYLKQKYQFWKKLKIVNAEPKFIFGSIKDFVLGRKHISLIYDDIYKLFPNEPYVGIFEILSPNLLIRDVELANRILVKDFNYFYDRGMQIDENIDPLFANNILNLSGVRWKSTRTKLTPAFSSSKLKHMYRLMDDCVSELEHHLEYFSYNKLNVDVREIMLRFSTDVIGRCAFGLDLNTVRNPNSEFNKIGKKIFRFSFRVLLRIIARLLNPKLLKWFKLKTVDKDVEQFFSNLLYDAVQYRCKDGERRHDILQLMINIQEQEKKLNLDQDMKFSDTLLVANMFIFYAGGLETTATTLSNCLYELALNEEIQNKLRSAIKTKFKINGEVNYEMLQDLPYLDAIISETLRKYAPIPFLSRICTEDYVLPGTQKIIPRGTRVTIPIYSFHHDAVNFPEPHIFNPDRFTNQNDEKSNTMQTYLPFGDGPRICIGLRLAKLEIKCCIAKLLLKYSFSPSELTVVPLKMKPRSIFLVPVSGIKLNILRLNN